MISTKNRSAAIIATVRAKITCLFNKTIRIGLIVVVAMAWSLSKSLASPEDARQPRITVLMVPGLKASDLERAELPVLAQLIHEGASGWMVCRAARPIDPDQAKLDGRESTDSLVLTLGCGARARIGSDSDPFVSPTPHSLHVSPFPPPNSLHLLRAANVGLGYTVTPGALGEAAHLAGYRTATLGNMDSDRSDRSVYLFAMDRAGRVDDAGERLSKILANDTSPFGTIANVDKDLADFDEVAPRDALRFIAFGELYRADRYQHLCTPSVGRSHRTTALIALNSFLRAISERVAAENRTPGVQSRLIVLSPSPADSTESRADTLAPVILWGAGINAAEITSPSTHRRGLIVNSDITRTVLEWMQARPQPGSIGQPIDFHKFIGNDRSAKQLIFTHDTLVSDAELQNLLGGLPTVQACLVVLGALSLLFGNRRSITRMSSIAVVTLPLAMLLLPTLAFRSPTGASVALALASLLVVGLVDQFGSVRSGRTNPVYLLSGMLCLVLLLDLATGCHLLQNGWMSYSAAEGSRFYGIGNEYMGAGLGAMLVLFAVIPWAVSHYKSKTIIDTTGKQDALKSGYRIYAAVFGVLVLLMVMPFAGAKVGAAPTLGIAGAIIYLAHRKGKFSVRQAVIVAGAIVGLIALAVVVDSHTAHSHLIRAITAEGGDGVRTVIKRKLAMELHLLIHSPWTFTLLISSIVLMGLRKRLAANPGGRDQRSDRAVFAALFGGAVAALLFNDAGVLAAALVTLYGCAWAILECTNSYTQTQIERDTLQN